MVQNFNNLQPSFGDIHSLFFHMCMYARPKHFWPHRQSDPPGIYVGLGCDLKSSSDKDFAHCLKHLSSSNKHI